MQTIGTKIYDTKEGKLFFDAHGALLSNNLTTIDKEKWNNEVTKNQLKNLNVKELIKNSFEFSLLFKMLTLILFFLNITAIAFAVPPAPIKSTFFTFLNSFGCISITNFVFVSTFVTYLHIQDNCGLKHL